MRPRCCGWMGLCKGNISKPMNFAQGIFCVCVEGGFCVYARNRPRGEEVMMGEEWIRKGDGRNVRKIK